MDVLLEPALSAPSPNPNPPGYMAVLPLWEWNEAYTKVEAYFHALRVENKNWMSKPVGDRRAQARDDGGYRNDLKSRFHGIGR